MPAILSRPQRIYASLDLDELNTFKMFRHDFLQYLSESLFGLCDGKFTFHLPNTFGIAHLHFVFIFSHKMTMIHMTEKSTQKEDRKTVIFPPVHENQNIIRRYTAIDRRK